MTKTNSLILLRIRENKVILDADLAAFYGVTTKAFNQGVKRNPGRFPEDFMFQLTPEEKAEVVTICDHLPGLKFSPYPPHAFMEYGVIMAAHGLLHATHRPPYAAHWLPQVVHSIHKIIYSAQNVFQNMNKEQYMKGLGYAG